MKLLTDALKQRFKEVGRQGKNPLVIAKFFDPFGSATWYATEYDPETNICHGYVTGLVHDEWGGFSIDELEAFTREVSMTILGNKISTTGTLERDLFFKETRFNTLMKNINN